MGKMIAAPSANARSNDIRIHASIFSAYPRFEKRIEIEYLNSILFSERSSRLVFKSIYTAYPAAKPTIIFYVFLILTK